MSKLIDKGLAALAELVTTERADEAEESAAKKLADFLAKRKAESIRIRAKAIERDLINLSITIENPADAAILKSLTTMSAGAAAADDGLAVEMLEVAEAAVKAKLDSLKPGHPEYPGPSNGEEGDKPEPLSAPQPFVWRDPRTIPLMPWIYGKHLLRGCVSLTVAPSGVGKTFLKIGETVAMTTGRTLLYDAPAGKLRCWFYNGEEPMEILERRFHAAFLHHNVTTSDIGDRLFVNDRLTKMVIARQSREGVTIMAPVKDALTAYIRENKIDVLSIDPFVSAHAVTENDNVAIDQVVKAYADIAQQTNCAIDLVHHARKTNGAAVGIEDARGASAAIGAVRAARTMNFMSPEEAKAVGIENRYGYVRIDDAKPNHAPRSEHAQWVQFQGIHLQNDDMQMFGDNVAVLIKWKWPDAMAGVTSNGLQAVWEAVEVGRWRHNVQAADWVGKPVAKALRLNLDTAADMAKVKSLINGWLKSGELVKIEGTDEQRKARTFIEVGKVKPAPPSKSSSVNDHGLPTSNSAPPPPAHP